MDEMEKVIQDVKYIQNTLWARWKEFQVDFDMRKYNRNAIELVHKYDGNREMLLFCQNQIMTWTPLLNDLKAKHEGRKR